METQQVGNNLPLLCDIKYPISYGAESLFNHYHIQSTHRTALLPSLMMLKRYYYFSIFVQLVSRWWTFVIMSHLAKYWSWEDEKEVPLFNYTDNNCKQMHIFLFNQEINWKSFPFFPPDKFSNHFIHANEKINKKLNNNQTCTLITLSIIPKVSFFRISYLTFMKILAAILTLFRIHTKIRAFAFGLGYWIFISSTLFIRTFLFTFG